MLTKDLFTKFDDLRDYTLLTDEMRTFFKLTQPLNAKNKYATYKDERIKEMFQYFSRINKQRDLYLDMIAFSVAVNIAQEDFRVATNQQIKEMERILGCEHSTIENYVAERYYLRPSAIKNQAHLPSVYIFTYAIRKAMFDKTNSTKAKTAIGVNKLRELINYLQDNGLLLQFEKSAVEEYEDFVMTHAYNHLTESICYYERDMIIKATAKYMDSVRIEMQKDLDQAFRKMGNNLKNVERTMGIGSPLIPLQNPNAQNPTPLELVDSIFTIRNPETPTEQAFEGIRKQVAADFPNIPLNDVDNMAKTLAKWTNYLAENQKHRGTYETMSRLEKEFHAAFDEEIDAIYQERKQRLPDDYLPVIAEGALLAFIEGDDFYDCKLGAHVWQDFFYECEFTLPVIPYPQFADEDEWDYKAPECNGKLGLPIVDFEDAIDYTDPEGNIEPIKVSAMISRLGDASFSAPLYIRKSYVNLFKSMGCSERKARDYAIIIAMLQSRSSMFFDKKLMDITDDSSENDGETASINKELAQAQIDKLAAEKAQARAEHEAQRCRHENSNLQREIERLQAELTLSKEEISKRDSLLELYEQAEDEEGDDTIDESIFPYNTSLKVVMYGGFSVFQRELLKYIPNVRIIETASHITIAPIKTADILFLQINRTSHSNYWLAIDTAKTNDVPFFHLNYASAKKCAKVMVEQIKELEKKK